MRGRACIWMPRVASPAKPLRQRAGDVEHVGDDADGGRHVARPAPGEEARPERPPLERDGVEDAVDVGERRVAPDERGVHAQLDALAAVAPDGEVLDDEAEALGEAVVDRIDAADPLGRDARRVDARAEREHRQDDELVRGVVPVDVERRIGLGVPLRLRLAAPPRRRRARRCACA